MTSPWRPLALLFVAALLGGCAGIPDEGPVVAGNQSAGTDPRSDIVQVVPDYPRAGADPRQIVEGFLEAAGGYDQNHLVARSYLSSNGTSWDPNQEVAVYPGVALEALTVRQTASGRGRPPSDVSVTGTGPAAEVAQSTPAPDATYATVSVTVPIEATVDASGHYRPARAGTSKNVTFQLLRSGGQWRISSLRNGIIISRSDFDLTFRAFPVYFPDPRGAFLVPDLRWFPGTRETSAALVRAVLEGPSAELRDAVVNGAPPGTRMAVSAVVVSGDVATVDLNERVRAATPQNRWRLESQLTNTLRRLRGISQVQITVRGAPLDISDAGVSSPMRVDPPVDGRPVVIRADGTMARVKNGRMEAVEGVEGLRRDGVTDPALSLDGTTYAVLTRDGDGVLVQTVDDDAPTAPLLTGSGLTPPSFDREGWVWTSPRSSDGVVLVARPGGEPVEVPAPELKGKDVTSLALSRDGARALITYDAGSTARLMVSPVARGDDGRPRSIGPGLSLVPDLTEAHEAAWADESTVAFLGRVGDGSERPWVVQVGGRVTELPTGGDIVSLAAGNGPLDMYAATGSGQLLVRAGEQWNEVGDARWPAFPG